MKTFLILAAFSLSLNAFAQNSGSGGGTSGTAVAELAEMMGKSCLITKAKLWHERGCKPRTLKKGCQNIWGKSVKAPTRSSCVKQIKAIAQQECGPCQDGEVSYQYNGGNTKKIQIYKGMDCMTTDQYCPENTLGPDVQN